MALRHALHRVEHKRVMEVVRFHEASCRAGLAEMKSTLDYNILINCPVSVRDVDNLIMVTPSGCNCCACGKAVNRSTNPQKQQQRTVDDQRATMPDAQRVDGMTGETLGMDLLFDDLCVFLIVVGKVGGFIHLTPLTNKKKAGINKAIKAILDDYTRNRVNITALDTRFYQESTVTRTESDNEGAFIAAGGGVLTKTTRGTRYG